MTTKTLDSRKIDLIVQISTLETDESVRRVETVVHSLENSVTYDQSNLIKKLAKPTRERIDIEELKRQQNWKPVNREEFERLVKEIDIQEPIEQLIVDIGK